jgi:hypothetical protein
MRPGAGLAPGRSIVQRQLAHNMPAAIDEIATMAESPSMPAITKCDQKSMNPESS